MSPIVTLTCPSCGGKLKITDEIEKFACSYCGAEHIVKRVDGSVYIKPILDNLNTIKSESDETANYLTAQRIREELSLLDSKHKRYKRSTTFWTIFTGILTLAAVFLLVLLISSAFSLSDMDDPVTTIIMMLIWPGVFVVLLIANKSEKETYHKERDAKLQELESLNLH